ncbi:uncharacterized protein PHACADRAFT_265089 [Phanerochaete carnosa HHB-10118-sp]|uniref:T6SS Phospholipase effector Tle1-like catalytic domain-containing protein n=1 Tax=Phanerochaete carnosa (strain HHB-10118-sp) TaxID=650164 RepID=K5UJ17_PHACS|nr:uncharacterized protein PHACADRAFT_265089 [Phanerochaete carnosa HHB-10118-sp]EKM49551.1 hypothetical protein PHACADRAFT_265089 [Phanerochaete carnosa HHB-10118-sp]
MSFDSVASVKPPKTRTLVLCFDGTSNQFDGDNTNVVKLYSLLKKDNTDDQLCYYQPGVGTYFHPGAVQPLFQWGARMLDEAIAWYLDEHVRGGYTFLMQNYRPGDKICIFGFSRGAYTARALAGMLHKIGLLPKDNPEQLPLAYKLFKNCDKNHRELAAGFKRTFCRSVMVEFIGVWDTVASVGLLRSKTLPFTTTNTTIKTFRHALALDERRAKFQPNLYHRLTCDASATVSDLIAIQEDAQPTTSPISAVASFDEENKRARMEADMRAEAEAAQPPPANENQTPADGKKKTRWLKGLFRKTTGPYAKVPCLQGRRAKKHDSIRPLDDPAGDQVETNVLEVWFAGSHGDVGGGCVPNDTPHALSDISLRWMVRQVVQAQCGIAFDSDALRRAGILDAALVPTGFTSPPPPATTPPTLAVKTDALPPNGGRPGDQQPLEAFGYGRASGESTASSGSGKSRAVATDAVPEDADATAPLFDQLRLCRFWWLLELMPTNYCYQDGDGKWHDKWSIHRGRGRHIPDKNPKVHESVKHRMEHPTLNYRPHAQWEPNKEEWVQ